MHHVVQRLGFRITRGWIALLVILGALLALGFWIGPFRPLPAELKLVALSSDGRFREAVQFPRSSADTTPPQPDVRARFPLVLAVYNSGLRVATPRQLTLSVPTRFRISNNSGQEFPGRVTVGSPLAKYVFTIAPGPIPPKGVPRVLTALDTLWLEPIVPSYYCTALSDSVPEFVPAPALDANELAHVRIFYSFDARTRDRQTGLLDLQLDPSLVERAPAAAPPIYPAQVIEPEAPRPLLGTLRRVGTRTTYCGDPGSALQITDVLWETAGGGRVFVVYHGGAARKYLFDLNRDSIIEQEMWDPDSDGKFEAVRPAHMPIPEFLMPARAPRTVLATVTDTISSDSLGAPSSAVSTATNAPPTIDYSPELFSSTGAGPLRFWNALQRARAPKVQPDSQAQPQRQAQPPATPTAPPKLLGDTVRRDTVRRDTLR